MPQINTRLIYLRVTGRGEEKEPHLAKEAINANVGRLTGLLTLLWSSHLYANRSFSVNLNKANRSVFFRQGFRYS